MIMNKNLDHRGDDARKAHKTTSDHGEEVALITQEIHKLMAFTMKHNLKCYINSDINVISKAKVSGSP